MSFRNVRMKGAASIHWMRKGILILLAPKNALATRDITPAALIQVPVAWGQATQGAGADRVMVDFKAQAKRQAPDRQRTGSATMPKQMEPLPLTHAAMTDESPHAAPLSPDLASHPILGRLSDSDRVALLRQFEYVIVPTGEILLGQGQLHQRTGLILSGTVAMQDPDLGVSVQLHSGALFGFGATPLIPLESWQAIAVTDCRIAYLQPDTITALCQQQGGLAYFFPSVPAFTQWDIDHTAMRAAQPDLLNAPLRTLLKQAPAMLAPGASIRAAAQLMCEQRISAVLLFEEPGLLGLITDRDLRNRVVAQGLDIDGPASDIATRSPYTLEARRPVFEAMQLMARHNIHHIPVTDGPNLVGMVTATDLSQQHSTSALYLSSDIHGQTSIEGLAGIGAHVKDLQQHLAGADASAYSTGQIITTITDALTTRLITLAEAALGPAPIDYVWVAAGSQARSEQTARSDQDNCLILDDSYTEAEHGDYFRIFSRFVCDGLAACGYILCPGGMMAMTDAWRQPRARWAQYFQRWVDEPQPKALMLTCVFFDLRAIHGKTELLEQLRHELLQRTRGNSLFLAHMVSNALKHRPPLGLFGHISLIRSGAHARTIDLKHTGIVPIVDLARVYALAGGIEAINTRERLDQAGQTSEVSEQSARDLRDALEFISKLRIAHQARQTQAGQAPDNFLALSELSNFERSQLKEAFAVVQTLQSVLAQRYQGGRC